MTEQNHHRERNMVAKRARILEAATKLFAEHDFAKVTTQAISNAADVAAGTLFRYATTKDDLLLMVYNGEFDSALAEGRAAAAQLPDSIEAVVALAAPVLARNTQQPENTTRYQRELLFGSRHMLHRAEGLQLVEQLEQAIVEILIRAAGTDDPPTRIQAEHASRIIFAALSLTLAQPSNHTALPRTEEFRDEVELIVRGFLATVHPGPEPEPGPQPTSTSHPQGDLT